MNSTGSSLLFRSTKPREPQLPPLWHGLTASGAAAAYDGLRDKHLKFDLRRAESAPLTHPSNLPPESYFAAAALGDRPLSRDAAARLHAQKQRYDIMVETPIITAPPLPVIPAKRDPVNEVRPEEVFIKARDKLLVLWDLLGIDDRVRGHFYATAFTEVTAESIAAMHAEIERLLALRAREVDVKNCIEVREGFLYVLMDIAERTLSGAIYESAPGSNTNADDDERSSAALTRGRSKALVKALPSSASLLKNGDHRALPATVAREVRSVVAKLRKASLDLVAAVEAWRAALGYDAVYLWRGTSYLLKMMTDTAFIAGVQPMAHAIGCLVVGNPLLDPSRTPDGAIAAVNQVRSAAALPRTTSAFAVARNPNSGIAPVAGSQQDKYDAAMRTLQAEPQVWAVYNAACPHFDFAALDDAEVDDMVVNSAYEDCFFRCPDDFSASARRRVVRDIEDRMMVISRVIKIQRAVRRMLGTIKARVEKKRHYAACKLQSQVRRLLAIKVVDKRRRQWHAAVSIQALARGVAVRQALRRRKAAAAIEVEAQLRSSAEDERSVLECAQMITYLVSRVQAVGRGALARRQCEKALAAERVFAASQVQKLWRGSCVRKSGVANPAKIRAALRLQCWYRRLVAERLVRLLLALRAQALCIQRVGRAFVSRGRTWRLRVENTDGTFE